MIQKTKEESAARTSRSSRRHTVLLYLVSGLVGGLFAVLGISWIDPYIKKLPRSNGQIYGFGAICIFGTFLVLLIHEVGHLLAGWLVGFRFQLLAIGPLKVERGASGRPLLGLNRNPAYFGGVALSLPTDSHNLTRRFAWVVAGGPILSLAVAVLALGTVAILPDGVGILPRTALVWIGACSGAIGLGTAIPMPMGAFLSDGLRFLRLIRGGELAARDGALLHLLSLATGKVPPINHGIMQ